MATSATLVEHVLDGARRPALVVTDLDLPSRADVRVIRPGDPKPDAVLRTVVLVSSDVAALRRDATRLGDLGWARMVGVVIVDTDRAVAVRAEPMWPPLSTVDARLVDGGGVTRLELAARAPAGPVLLALARAAGLPVPAGHRGLRVSRAYAGDETHPPDVLLTRPLHAPPVSPVTGRAPLVVTDAGEPLDEGVYCPLGFRRTWTRGMVDLPPGTRLSPRLVRSLRDAQGVHLPLDADPDLAAGLALAGVPTEQHDDPDERLRHVRLTWRVALRRHSGTAWRARLAERAGVRFDSASAYAEIERLCAPAWAPPRAAP